MPLSAIYRQLDDHLGTDETPYNAGAALERLMGWMEEGSRSTARPTWKMGNKGRIRKPSKKVCLFCQENIIYVDYKDTTLLRKFISDRGKIRARRVTGNCTRHQREIATAIKQAREMAILPSATSAARQP